MNQEIEVFRDQYLEGNTITITSDPVSAMGNKVVVNVTVTNAASGTDVTTVTLEGSYDGLAWERPAGISVAITGTIGNGNIALASMDYAFVRLHAATGSGDKTLFDASLAFSEQ